MVETQNIKKQLIISTKANFYFGNVGNVVKLVPNKVLVKTNKSNVQTDNLGENWDGKMHFRKVIKT